MTFTANRWQFKNPTKSVFETYPLHYYTGRFLYAVKIIKKYSLGNLFFNLI